MSPEQSEHTCGFCKHYNPDNCYCSARGEFELYEEGSQIRRSVKSVKSNIVEGYGRRRYKAEFIKFLTYAIASNDETTDHLENLVETKSFRDRQLFIEYSERLDKLGRKLNKFLQSVENNHISVK